MTSARPRGAGLEPFEDIEASCTSALEVFGRGIFEEDLAPFLRVPKASLSSLRRPLKAALRYLIR